jgi:methylthioribose-1-phosphate isomerase
MQKNQTTGYDATKKMLNTLRKLNESRSTSYNLIKENDEFTQQPEPQDTENPQEDMMDDITVVNDVDVKLMSGEDMDLKLMDDQKSAISNIIDNFRQQVSQIVDLEPGFTVTPTQIRLDGVLTDQDIKFVLIAGDESGVYIIADMLKLENEVGMMLEKLAKFDDTFKSAMEPIITQRDNN